MDIIVYGTGMIGNLVRQYFEIMGISEYIKVFALSNNVLEDEFYGYKVECIDNLIEYKKKSLVIIATLPDVQSEIKGKLQYLGFKNILSVDFNLYKEMTHIYINNFLLKKRMKTSYDIIYMSSDNNKTSGAFLCMIDLVKDINNKGLNTLVILPEYGNGEELLIKERIDYTYVPSTMGLKRIDGKKLTWQELDKKNNSYAIECLEKIIDKFSVKVVHCNTIYTYVGAIAANNKNIPVVWHIRENIFEQGYIYKNKKYFYELINKSYKIITVSNYIGKCYQEFNDIKTYTIYDGLNLENYYIDHTIFDDDEMKILMPGAIYSLKRQEDLIMAATLLKKENIPFHINFAGVGEEKYINKLKKIIDENKLEHNISFLGRVDDMKKSYNSVDIVISCSGVESFGRVCVEGFISGCLVVGADSGGTKELIDNNKTGLFFQYKNPYDLAGVLKYVYINKDKMKKIALNGQKMAIKKFSKNKVSEEVYSIYQEIIK